jgi:uncharacterized protein YndB with AHSA1/START domain
MTALIRAAVVVALVATPAHAELRQTAADGFLVEHHYDIKVPPAEAWAILVHPERYWPEDHTWSGKRAHLGLVAEAGGCFCERWDASSVEHGRVVMALPGKLLRIRGSLGPLQEMAVAGVLTIALKPAGAGTQAIVTYRVSGDSLHALANLAPVVDEVIGIQFAGFATLANGG